MRILVMIILINLYCDIRNLELKISNIRIEDRRENENMRYNNINNNIFLKKFSMPKLR